MAFANRMTSVINKIETRLGTRPMNLPDHLKKDKWADKIEELSLPTWSRFYPFKINYTVMQHHKKGDYYLIDEKIAGNVEILGVRDLNWGNLSNNTLAVTQQYGVYDMYANDYGYDDMMLLQTRADHASLFNNGLFVDFVPPNKIQVKDCNGVSVVRSIPSFDIEIFIQHNKSLSTIFPTQMETFETLAQADIATFLYQELKLFDGLETVYANIELKLEELKEESLKREQIVQDMKDAYVSAGNSSQPIMFTI